ncbi:MAG: efflux transporter periplasmic adaptor subunit, partial [Steroidobacteraceae bacterium]
MRWKLIGILVAGTVVVGAAAVYWIANRAAPPRYVTTAVTQGDVVTTITASGSVNPVVVVEVGTYVSGTIETLSCDYNTRVHKGQLCAKIDPKPYQVVVDQDQADLGVAKAQLVKDRANVVYTKITHERDDLLYSEDSISHDAA